MINLILPFKRKKIKVTPEEMKRINSLKSQASFATHPKEVQMFRQEIGLILKNAELRRK